MSREIRFRVWSETARQYLPKTQTPWLRYDGSLWSQSCCHWGQEEDLVEGVVAEQYTGLKDKAGRDIYEGDIIKASLAGRDDDITDPRGIIVGVISYRHDTAGFSISPQPSNPAVRCDLSTFHMRDHNPSRRFEVVGNIHQHSELLGEPRP